MQLITAVFLALVYSTAPGAKAKLIDDVKDLPRQQFDFIIVGGELQSNSPFVSHVHFRRWNSRKRGGQPIERKPCVSGARPGSRPFVSRYYSANAWSTLIFFFLLEKK